MVFPALGYMHNVAASEVVVATGLSLPVFPFGLIVVRGRVEAGVGDDVGDGGVGVLAAVVVGTAQAEAVDVGDGHRHPRHPHGRNPRHRRRLVLDGRSPTHGQALAARHLHQ